MSQPVQAIPQGFHTLTPHLIVRNADQAIEFYKKAFGAEVVGDVARMPNGKVMHALLRIGDSNLMLNDEMPEYGALSPASGGSSSVTIHIYTKNIDAAFERATSAGAEVKMPLADQFWGDRYGVVTDPSGHKWSLAAHVKDLSPEQMKTAMSEAMAKMPPPRMERKTA
jgi:PhnB protein